MPRSLVSNSLSVLLDILSRPALTMLLSPSSLFHTRSLNLSPMSCSSDLLPSFSSRSSCIRLCSNIHFQLLTRDRVLWGLIMTLMGFVYNWSGLMAARVSFSHLSFLITELTQTVVPWSCRSRSLPRSELLPLLLVPSLRVRHPCCHLL